MNLAFIRYFLAVAETGNFTEAAERCHVTQPTLSAGVARLEEEIGSRLFDRGRRSALSAAGQRLLPHARAMVEAWRLARAEQRSSRRTRLVRDRARLHRTGGRRPCSGSRRRRARSRSTSKSPKARPRRWPSAGGAAAATSPSSRRERP